MTPPQESLLDWADAHDVSYLAWGWTTANCAGEPALITDYDGTPTSYGAGIRQHLLSLAPQERPFGRRGQMGVIHFNKDLALAGSALAFSWVFQNGVDFTITDGLFS